MASSSRYVQLSQNVLLEYIYSDQSVINTPGNPWRISTDDTPIWITKNEYTNQPQILNADSAEDPVGNGSYTKTNNVRNRSFAVIGSHKGALLDIDKSVFYNDFDPKLTKTGELPLIIDKISPVYDKVRIHMVQGFDFESNVGMVLSLKFNDIKNNDIVLANFAYLKGDSWETLNPSAFFFGGRVYNTYVEFKVLSLYNLIDDYWLRKSTDGEFVDRITDRIGIKRNQFIQVYFSYVREKITSGGQDYINLTNVKSIDLPIRDQFEQISAFIKESDAFDYIEYYATFDGEIINQYIAQLNNSGGSYMIIHELNISEYIYDASSDTKMWIYTDKLQNIQDNDFSRINTFRPVIKNSAAISFKIEYVVRLFNKNDGSQVWKTSSLISMNVNKYGKKLKSIGISENIIKAKIYNQSIVKEITVNKLPEKYISNTKYVTSLFNISNVSVSSSLNYESFEDSQLSGMNSPEKIYDNGLSILHIPNADCFIQFNVYQRVNSNYSLFNLSGFEEFILSFIDGTVEDFDIIEYPDPSIDKGKGQLIFKLSKEQTSKILSFSDRTFTIYQKNGTNTKTYLYSGKFYSTEEINKINEINKISELEKKLNDLNTKLTAANFNLLEQQNYISQLNNEILNLSKTNNNLSAKIAETDPAKAIELLKKENESLLNKINSININSLNAASSNSKSTIWTSATSQSRSSLMDIWNTNSDNIFSNNNTNLDQSRLEINNSANIKTTNVSNFNPRDLSV